MPGLPGLHQDGAGPVGAAGAAGDLGEQLRHPLGGAEVGTEQATVGIGNHHQGQRRPVMALGQQLRADQDCGLAAVDAGHGSVELGAGTDAVAIDAQHRQLREMRLQLGVDALGADAAGEQLGVLALGAGLGFAPPVAAVVATAGQPGAGAASWRGRNARNGHASRTGCRIASGA